MINAIYLILFLIFPLLAVIAYSINGVLLITRNRDGNKKNILFIILSFLVSIIYILCIIAFFLDREGTNNISHIVALIDQLSPIVILVLLIIYIVALIKRR